MQYRRVKVEFFLEQHGHLLAAQERADVFEGAAWIAGQVRQCRADAPLGSLLLVDNHIVDVDLVQGVGFRLEVPFALLYGSVYKWIAVFLEWDMRAVGLV